MQFHTSRLVTSGTFSVLQTSEADNFVFMERPTEKGITQAPDAFLILSQRQIPPPARNRTPVTYHAAKTTRYTHYYRIYFV